MDVTTGRSRQRVARAPLGRTGSGRRTRKLDTIARQHGEGGAALVVALVFLAVIGLISAAILAFSDSSVLQSERYREIRDEQYDVDGALEVAVNEVKDSPDLGADPEWAGGDPDCVVTVDGITVSCAAIASNWPDDPTDVPSGFLESLGEMPDNAILTLGRRRFEEPHRHEANLGVLCGSIVCYHMFNPQNGSDICQIGTPNQREVGIHARRQTSVCSAVGPLQNWRVDGDIWTNSPIWLETATLDVTGSVNVRGGTLGNITATGGVTNRAWNYADPDGADSDPGYAHRPINWANVNNADLGGIPANCSNLGHPATRHFGVVFSPGVYTDVVALNNLFAHSSCVEKSFWFQPGTHYFNFNQAGTNGNLCNLGAGTRNVWCVGNGENFLSRVIAGAPYGWDPEADETASRRLECRAAAPCSTTWLDFFWSNSGNARQVNGATADFTLGFFAWFGQIAVTNFPKVPNGSYGGPVDVEVTHRVTNANRMSNPPRIYVRHGGLFGANCPGGPYALRDGGGNASYPTGGLATYNLSPADQATVGNCLNTATKLNSAWVVYEVNRPFWQVLGPYATAHLDGVDLVVSQAGQPTFPQRDPDPAADNWGGDPGGDCDPYQPGAQFVFGGESRVAVASGSLEICAGPEPKIVGESGAVCASPLPYDGDGRITIDPSRPRQCTIDAPQIGVYQAPAPPPLRPASYDQANSDHGKINNPNNAVTGITNPDGTANSSKAGIVLDDGCAFGCMRERVLTLNFPQASIPAGYEVDDVYVRASYDTNNAIGTRPGIRIWRPGTNSFDCWGGDGFNRGLFQSTNRDPGAAQVHDVSSCLRGRIGQGAFKVSWMARGDIWWPATFTDYLQGVEIYYSLRPVAGALAENLVVRTATGCHTALGLPNYWNGYGDSQANRDNPDCAVIRSGVERGNLFFNPIRRGRSSVKGTIYVPSSAIDYDERCVSYPLATRGIIARHLRVRNFAYSGGPGAQSCLSGQPNFNGQPIISNVEPQGAAPRRVEFVACTNPDLTVDPGLGAPRYCNFTGVPPENETDPTLTEQWRQHRADRGVVGRAVVSFISNPDDRTVVTEMEFSAFVLDRE